MSRRRAVVLRVDGYLVTALLDDQDVCLDGRTIGAGRELLTEDQVVATLVDVDWSGAATWGPGHVDESGCSDDLVGIAVDVAAALDRRGPYGAAVARRSSNSLPAIFSICSPGECEETSCTFCMASGSWA